MPNMTAEIRLADARLLRASLSNSKRCRRKRILLGAGGPQSFQTADEQPARPLSLTIKTQEV